MRATSYGNFVIRLFKCVAGLMLLVFASAEGSSALAQTIPGDPVGTCTVPPATFKGWFEPGSVTSSGVNLNGIAKPADSVNFPNTPNCSFYQWSMQMFLWVTSPGYGGTGRVFDSPVFYDVSPPDAMGHRTFIPHKPGLIRFLNVREAQLGPNRLPVVVDKSGAMFEVEKAPVAASGKPLLLNRSGQPTEVESARIENGKPLFLDKSGKAIANAKPALRPQIAQARQLSNARIAQQIDLGNVTVFLNSSGNVIDVEQGQAGGGQVLMAQNKSLVYYVTMVNDVFAYFLTGAKNGGITPMPTQFPTTQTDLNKITAFASAHGATITDPNALAVELKTSWIEASGLTNPNDYITMTATIPTYDTSNPNTWTLNGTKTVTLALIGVHVVGSTKGHPEMIWATFEHKGATPNGAYGYNSTSGFRMVNQDTSGQWLFSASNSNGSFNVAHMKLSGTSIQSIGTNTISPSDTLRVKPWGGASNASPNPLDPTVAASNTEIISINNSVSTQMPPGDVRDNYFFTGATWTIGGAAPTSNFANPGNPGGNTVGTSQLNNTTMETYQQGTATFNTVSPASSNCFFCHTNNTTSVSHIYPGLQPLFP